MNKNQTTNNILEFIIAYNKEKKEPPIMLEIAQKFGITKGSVQYHINVLKEQGKIVWFEAKSGWKPL